MFKNLFDKLRRAERVASVAPYKPVGIEPAKGGHVAALPPITHPDRFPYHHRAQDVIQAARDAGFTPTLSDPYLPRGQRLCLCPP